MNAQQTTIKLARQLIALVKGSDYSDFDEHAPLELDSINRIGLISELENALDLEIDLETFSPENFDNLSNLADFIAGIK